MALKTGLTPPSLHSCDGDLSGEWYVGFRHTCPLTLVRKGFQLREGINYFKTVAERTAEGNTLVRVLHNSNYMDLSNSTTILIIAGAINLALFAVVMRYALSIGDMLHHQKEAAETLKKILLRMNADSPSANTFPGDYAIPDTGDDQTNSRKATALADLKKQYQMGSISDAEYHSGAKRIIGK